MHHPPGFLRPRLPALVLAAALSGCTPPVQTIPDAGMSTDAGALGDPCAPHGHIHREAGGDWCHCDRGYLEKQGSLGCEQDPDYDPSAGFSFGDEGKSACWRLANTSHLTVAASEPGAPTINRFDTVYRVELQGSDGQYSRTVTYDAAGTGDFILHLGKPVPVTLVEQGKGPVALLAEKEATTCEGFQRMVGVGLADGVRYSLTLGPTSEPVVHLLIEQLP